MLIKFWRGKLLGNKPLGKPRRIKSDRIGKGVIKVGG
jgi:hypothetical protein